MLIRAARILDGQVDADGWLGGSPERVAEQVEAGRKRRKLLKGERVSVFS